MRRYTVEIERKAEKQLERIRVRRTVSELYSAIYALADDPRPDGVKKLVGHRDLWRIRVGGWRVVYRIEEDRLVVVVVAVGGRGGVYGVV